MKNPVGCVHGRLTTITWIIVKCSSFSWNRYVFVLLLKEVSSLSSNTTSNTTRVKTEIKQHAKMGNCGARRGDTHITEPTEPAQRYVYPLLFSSLAKGNIVDII